MHHHGSGGGFVLAGLLHGLIGLGLLVLITLVCIWLVRHLMAGAPTRRDPAEQDLRRRYAAGEVERDDYLTRMGDLREQTQSSSTAQ